MTELLQYILTKHTKQRLKAAVLANIKRNYAINLESYRGIIIKKEIIILKT